VNSEIEISILEPYVETEDCRRLMLKTDPWKTLGFGEKEVQGVSESTRNGNLVVARQDGKVVGFALSVSGMLLGEYLKTLVVDRELRSQGLGKQLMDAFEKRAFSRYPNAYLCVSSFNEGALRFYQNLGYQKVGELTELFVKDHHEVLMRKTRGPWRDFRKNG